MTHPIPTKAYFHLPGLYEFFDFYKLFLPFYFQHKHYFYEWAEIGSIYGAPADCIWGGGRISESPTDSSDVLSLIRSFGISPRLTFSNSQLTEEHLSDRKCNEICSLFSSHPEVNTGIILYSDLLLDYLKKQYPNFYYVSSTTKVLTDFPDLVSELNNEDFSYVVPDFRLNKAFTELIRLNPQQKAKLEFLCNECCDFNCKERKRCYDNISLRTLGIDCPEHHCSSPMGKQGYRFSLAMKNPAFISNTDIIETYLPNGFSQFKIEGRGLGSALLLEFILYYLTKPEHQIEVREEIYLDPMLDLF